MFLPSSAVHNVNKRQRCPMTQTKVKNGSFSCSSVADDKSGGIKTTTCIRRHNIKQFPRVSFNFKLSKNVTYEIYYITPLGFGSRQGKDLFCATASRPVLGHTQLPIEWRTRDTSLGVEQPGLEADHSPPSIAEVKNAWGYTSTSTLPYTFMVRCVVTL
jgi:hypothetical protein